MRNIFRILFISLICVAVARLSVAREFQFGNFKSTESIKSTAAGCGAPSGFRFLHVNNVRARINTGGDMWWDLPGGIGAQYFIPANGSATSLFSGSLWIGGLDINNQLKLAALRYRQIGQDYWTGPLTIDGTAAIDEETCSEWDKFFRTTRAEIDEFIDWFNSDNRAEDFPGYSIPNSILDYPAHGDISKGQSYYLAPFKDVDGDGDYDPGSGDYPYYDITNELCPLNYAGDPNYVPTPTMETELYYPDYFGGILVDQVLKGDENLWWVFNDKGNFHTETNGAAIGMEIRAQAFGFATNDEINNMTFYSYEIINRSTYVLTQTYFSPWVDTDLGYAWDDYVGCDVNRGLGYCSNGTPVDGGGEPEAYGEQPPAIGVDFFQGPYIDPDTCDNPAFYGDGLLGPSFDGDCSIVSFHGTEITMEYGPDTSIQTGLFKVRSEAINGVNFGNGIVDDERYGMRRFVYHNNSGGPQGDPGIAPEYYNYLRGFWKDNSRMLYGGNAHLNSGALGPECDFMFPGDTDPCNWGTSGIPPNGGFNQNGYYWTEEVTGNNPYDRRFMQSAGPFTLQPGAVNYITVGMPWARAIAGGPWASVELLRVVDDKCQALFDNCFKVINGPDAPDLTFQELDKELIIYITNSKISNNYIESYKERDPQIKTPDSLIGTPEAYDPYYYFEGYQIFQLKDATVTISESRHDPDKVRLVAEFDIRNGVGQLVNFYYDQAIGANVPVVEVDGGDNGVVHSFRIFEDQFATGDRTLVNHKQYYYSVLAYGYNNFKDYDQTDPTKLDGQKKPYLAGRKNIQLYTAIPHKSINGIIMNSEYGDGPQITRIEGQGNGGMVLELSEETIEEILNQPPALSVIKEITPAGDTIYNNYGDPDYPLAYNAVYKYGNGPVNIKVIDPLNVKGADYSLEFDTAFFHFTFHKVTKAEGMQSGGDTVGVNATRKWVLTDLNTGNKYVSDTSTNINYEQLFPELGISITFGPVYEPGPYKIGEMNNAEHSSVYIIPAENNGLIEFSIEYADSSRQWLGGVSDYDVPYSPLNWIRSGTYRDNNDAANDDYNMPGNPLDPDEAYEKIVNGTWAPYCMCAYEGTNDAQNMSGCAPAFDGNSKSEGGRLKTISSIDIVLTPDKSKWTRSPVIEMCPDVTLSEGNADRFLLRRSPSLDKDGNPAEPDANVSDDPDDPNYIHPNGMSWFPGYAINLETGERLNIMFGEDSWLVGENGRDMLFNPTSSYFDMPSRVPLFGGKHYVYIMRSCEIIKTYDNNAKTDTLKFTFPAYDAGKTLVKSIDTLPPKPSPFNKIYGSLIYASVMYAGIPLSVDNEEWLSNEARIRIRIEKPYERYYSEPLDSIYGEGENKYYPLYSFSTEGIATTYFNQTKAENDLDMINVVPNPYYAYSEYERVPLDNRIKITYLPEKCTVTIYNVSGTLIRQYTKDDPVTFIDWDLKNHAGIPIAGGIYLIHVKDETTGEEKIIKWFGSLRVEDFNEF